MSDVFFDNILTDYAFHQEIKRGQQEIMRCYACLQDLGHAADKRRMELEVQLKRQEQELKTARADLQRARQGVFQSVLRSGGSRVDVGDGDRGVVSTPAEIHWQDSQPPAYEDAIHRVDAPAYVSGVSASTDKV
ncbi:hypothetical protein NQ176_g10677 [Zarea fungicola]|uniref:Uncharacterized protein n=1 Tax=Zarea fungicola TaxID=93591 RepID=A0ACC1MEG8_9HYPO|nr:hypothetical protein NQ176_g10677 [Lecanicillium fungicola]